MKFTALFIFAVFAIWANAQGLTDSERENALSQTQSMLRNQKARQNAINQDPHAKDTDDKVTALTGGGQNKEDVYELSAQVMGKIVEETKGDPEKMQNLLLQAQKDPSAFANKYMDSSQQAKVKDIAHKIDKQGASGPAAH